MKQHQHHSEAVSSSSSPSSAVSDQSQPSVKVIRASTTASEKPSPAAEDPTSAASRDVFAAACQDSVTIERRGGGDYAAVCKWSIANFARVKARALWSKYFEVGGYDCRLLVYPKGDSQALPGYISIYLHIMDPRGISSSKWGCFASYRLAIVNTNDELKSIHRDSWHRFSSKKKSHGWCDFTPSGSILDPKSGFICSNDSILITAEILVLNESVNFTRDNIEMQSNSMVSSVVSGPVGDYLSMCLESKDTEKTMVADRSCWCLFRMSVLNQKPGLNHMHRDSYGRFAGDNMSGDNTSLGWNDYMKMLDFVGNESGFLVDDTAVFSTSFHVIKEFSSFSKSGGLSGVRIVGGARKSDGHLGKFTWRIENFTRLKNLLKKRKLTGLCIKSKRFQIGNRDCRLIVIPESQPPCHLSVFLEVTDSRNTLGDWSCFVSHRLSVVNQKMEDNLLRRNLKTAYSKAAKDWGWREFVTLTSLFDQDSRFRFTILLYSLLKF